MYALLILAQGFLNAQTHTLDIWVARRCFEHTRGELIITIYEKAVSRKVIVASEEPANAEAANTTANGNDSNGHVNGSASNAQSNNQNGIANGDTNGDANGKATDKKEIKSNKNALLKLIKEIFWPTKETKDTEIKRASTGQILNMVRSDANTVAKRFTDLGRLIKSVLGSIFTI